MGLRSSLQILEKRKIPCPCWPEIRNQTIHPVAKSLYKERVLDIVELFYVCRCEAITERFLRNLNFNHIILLSYL